MYIAKGRGISLSAFPRMRPFGNGDIIALHKREEMA